MYPQFFGFDKLPFRLRPDPEFLFPGDAYRQARADLLAGVRSRSRVVLLLGRPGVGKTLLLEDVLPDLAHQFTVCRINQPHISATELIQALLLQLDVPTAEDDKNRATLFKELAAALDAADTRHVVHLLVIDDAQMLAGKTVTAIGDILARAPSLKVLLIARDEEAQRGESLASRVAVTEIPRQIVLQPLTPEGTKAYIDHRLKISGGAGKEIFTADAYAAVFQHSGGTPRLVNVLCDAALHAACLRASGHVTAVEITTATQDARWSDALGRHKASAQAQADDVDETAPPAYGGVETVAAPDAGAGPEPPPNVEAPLAAVTPAAVTPTAVTPPGVAIPLAADRAARPHAAPNGAARGGDAKGVKGAHADASKSTAQPQDLPHAAARLVVSHLKRLVTTCRLNGGRISIGRATDNELQLDAPYISRHHCQVVTVDNVSTIEDLGSVNGIVVNGKTVKRHVLRHADQIALGQHLLTYMVD